MCQIVRVCLGKSEWQRLQLISSQMTTFKRTSYGNLPLKEGWGHRDEADPTSSYPTWPHTAVLLSGHCRQLVQRLPTMWGATTCSGSSRSRTHTVTTSLSRTTVAFGFNEMHRNGVCLKTTCTHYTTHRLCGTVVCFPATAQVAHLYLYTLQFPHTSLT